MQYVVFGATGYIGSYLLERLKNDGFYVIGTGRSFDHEDGMAVYDILHSSLQNVTAAITDSDKTAIICIAESNIDRCCEDYSNVYKVNVIRTRELIHELSAEGFRVIYFSSDQVFDGIAGDYTEESRRHPVNRYGEMKSEMEDYLLENEPEVCIFRIPKVVSALRKKQNVFSDWTDRMETGKIRCIKGNRLSFVSIDDIYGACLTAAEKRLCGLYNIAGDKAYSRAELARMFYDRLGVQRMDISECGAEEFYFKEKRPLNLSMSNAKFKSETGYFFEPMESVLDRYIENLKK